jgi:predicted DNA-binding protein (UPF0251 family)
MARPKGSTIKIDVDEVTRWAKTGATQADIAAKLGVSIATFERRLRDTKIRQALLVGKGELCVSLRAKQVQVALSGNVTMLRWLGEQYLGQSHSHRFVDKAGEDKDVVAVSVLRDWIHSAPAADEK